MAISSQQSGLLATCECVSNDEIQVLDDVWNPIQNGVSEMRNRSSLCAIKISALRTYGFCLTLGDQTFDGLQR